MISVANLPAAVLAQRPDVYAAERDVAAASFDVGSAQAQRYPRLMLNGSIGTLNYTNAAGTTPIALTGNALAQTITGNAGANILNTGGGAADLLIGGAGVLAFTAFMLLRKKKRR